MDKPFFAFGTSFNHEEDNSLKVVVEGIKFLKQHMNEDGTWGGDDSLDRLISTNHCVMTFLCMGFSYNSYLLKRAIDYLLKLKPQNEISFFWRAGALLNIPEFKSVVQHDANYIWKNRKRIGVHPYYPLPFFLLKLVYFNKLDIKFEFKVSDVIKWIVEDFDIKNGWYDKSSITSMASSILYHFNFKQKKEIIDASIKYLIQKYQNIDKDHGKFDDNIVDDCFTIYNLYETSFIHKVAESKLHNPLKKVFNRIFDELNSNAFLESSPPFGGNVSHILYPTAVALRAIIAYKTFYDHTYINKIGNSLVNSSSFFILHSFSMKKSIKPVVQKIKFDNPGKKLAFIMMPFTPSKQFQSIVDSIKLCLKKYDIVGIRADDKEYTDDLFDNVMAYIYSADFGIAIFERVNGEYFNPNISLEVGYMMALNKQVCLLKEKSLKGLQTDLVGKLYRSFDIFSIKKTIDVELSKWLKDKDFI